MVVTDLNSLPFDSVFIINFIDNVQHGRELLGNASVCPVPHPSPPALLLGFSWSHNLILLNKPGGGMCFC